MPSFCNNTYMPRLCWNVHFYFFFFCFFFPLFFPWFLSLHGALIQPQNSSRIGSSARQGQDLPAPPGSTESELSLPGVSWSARREETTCTKWSGALRCLGHIKLEARDDQVEDSPGAVLQSQLCIFGWMLKAHLMFKVLTWCQLHSYVYGSIAASRCDTSEVLGWLSHGMVEKLGRHPASWFSCVVVKPLSKTWKSTEIFPNRMQTCKTAFRKTLVPESRQSWFHRFGHLIRFLFTYDHPEVDRI